jgi:hypothetical protein
MHLRTALPFDDAQALGESLAWLHDAGSRQTGLHLLIEGLLIKWLAEATETDRGAVIQRLAFAIETLLLPG